MDSESMCRKGLHDLSEPGARNLDGRCAACNAAYHRAWRARTSARLAAAREAAAPRRSLLRRLFGAGWL